MIDHTELKNKVQGQRLFEVSYEVCNKVGGIHTVVSSKAELLDTLYNEYFLIGPYYEQSAHREFQKMPVPDALRPVFESFAGTGCTLHYGRWLIKGQPQVILIDFQSAFNDLDTYKKMFWEKFGVDSLSGGFDFSEPFAFSVVAGKLIEAFHTHEPYKKSVAQFHEWMCGFGGLYLKAMNIPVGFVFTTHATILGRSLSGSGGDFYGRLDNLDMDEEAKRCGITPKFTAERASAQFSDVFTTVSELTAMEATRVLGRKPDVIMPNGLDMTQFPSFEEASVNHTQSRQHLREYCMYHFFPYHQFDLEHTLFFYVSGRFEVVNKGIDITVAALSKLNQKLKAENSKRNIVVFFWVPAEFGAPHKPILESKSFFKHIKDFIAINSERFESTILDSIVSGSEPECNVCFNNEFLHEASALSKAFRKGGYAPIASFECPESNPILQLCYEHGLLNRPEDKVRVVLYPKYLDGVDGLLDYSYYQAISGCHLGLFASYYEPWGYTPQESVTLGVPAVTSDLAGFGRFVEGHEVNNNGIFVLERDKNKFDQEKVLGDYVSIMYDYAKQNRSERVDEKINAYRFAQLTDWNILIKHYVDAHNKSLK